MRLWSLHPCYLDSRGIVALWREALLAQKVLLGKTKGYGHHPQLQRFKSHSRPVPAIAAYLRAVCEEAGKRNYHFDAAKIGRKKTAGKMAVTRGQLRYEFEWLLKKLEKRDRGAYARLKEIKNIKQHPSFRVVPGPVASWEKGG